MHDYYITLDWSVGTSLNVKAAIEDILHEQWITSYSYMLGRGDSYMEKVPLSVYNDIFSKPGWLVEYKESTEYANEDDGYEYDYPADLNMHDEHALDEFHQNHDDEDQWVHTESLTLRRDPTVASPWIPWHLSDEWGVDRHTVAGWESEEEGEE
jgi:hypothetical protein